MRHSGIACVIEGSLIHRLNEPYVLLIPSHRIPPYFGLCSFPISLRVGGWIDLGGWFHTKIVCQQWSSWYWLGLSWSHFVDMCNAVAIRTLITNIMPILPQHFWNFLFRLTQVWSLQKCTVFGCNRLVSAGASTLWGWATAALKMICNGFSQNWCKSRF